MCITDNLDSRHHDEDDHHHSGDYYCHHNNNHIDVYVGHKSSDVFNGDDIKQHNEHRFDDKDISIDIN